MYGVPPASHQPHNNVSIGVERRKSLARNSSSQVEVHDAVCNMRLNSPSPQPAMEPPIRTQSETSLYAPARRRSIILTPGIATRSEPRTKSLKKNASFRNSIGPSPVVSRQNSIDSKIKRRQSLPVPGPSSALGGRSSTPTDFEYQQIGGMKFGSLHITNGAPAPSPANELTEAALMGIQTQEEAHGLHMSSGQMSNENHVQMPRPSLPIQSLAVSSSGISDHEARTVQHGNGPDSVGVATLRSPSPELQTTSKHTAVDDDLFEEEETSLYGQTEQLVAAPTDAMTGSAMETSEQAKPTRPSLVSIIRKDSGYVSQSSKPSRASSSANDSGYASGASFSSRQHSRNQRQATESSDYLTSADQSINSNGSTPSTESSSNVPSPLRSEDTPSEGTLQLSISSKDDGSVSTPRTSTSSAPQSFIRLPSLKSKDRQAKQLKKVASSERPRSPATLLQRVASPTKPSPLSGGPSSPRMNGLRRFLSGSSRKGLATSYAVHELDSAVPSVPIAVEEKLQEHNGRFPTAPQRLALRVEASRDSLGTIMSVEDPSENTGNDAPNQSSTAQAIEERKVVEDKALGRRRSHKLSVSSVSSTFSDAASAVLSTKSPSRRSMVRRRMTTDGRPPSRSSSRRRANVDSDSDDEVIVDSVMVDHRDFMLPDSRRSIGNRSFDQALIDQGRYPPSDSMAWLREPYVDPRAPLRHHPLRSRKSAPDVRQTAAGHLSPVLEREYSKVSRTPPPISMQTRGSKKHKKRSMPKASRRQSSPSGMPPGRRMAQFDLYDSGSSNASSYEDLSHYPSAAANEGPYPRITPMAQYGSHPDPSIPSVPKPKVKRPLFPQRYSYDGHGQRPMYIPPQRPSPHLAPVPSRQQSKEDWLPNRSRMEQGHTDQQEAGPEARDQHGGARVSGEAAPFRVLHSYNSPAYRGIPIWG